MTGIWRALLLLTLSAHAAAATLEIVDGDSRRAFSQSQLLSRPDLESIVVADSVYKDQWTRFKAIPVAHLITGLAVADRAVVRFDSEDGFSAILGAARLLSTDRKASEAYLAIEDPHEPWPPLPGKTTSAGPFYLVWRQPQLSGIGREEWPFKIAAVTILDDPRRVFPNIYPADQAPQSVQNGFKSFQKNCFPCHQMNGSGAATIGPDLNLPMNPTEYLDAPALEALIRNPASVRKWPGMAMRGFSVTALPDAELADLIAYLRYMSTRKVNAK